MRKKEKDLVDNLLAGEQWSLTEVLLVLEEVS